MSIWIIVSWVLVAILTGINVFIFMKLKTASEQMMKMAFPGAGNMGEAMAQMQKMMQGMQGMQPRGGRGPVQPQLGGKNMDAQLKAAMDMLQNMQKKR
jgi:hypothetical protein